MHDLKHTFGRRLHAAGVSFEDRQDHPSGRIATHYSGGELASLLAAANRVYDGRPHKIPALVVFETTSACQGIGKRLK